MIVNKSMFPISQSFSSTVRMQENLAKLEMQLATNKKATSLADMGRDRTFNLTLRNSIWRVEGYQENIANVHVRLNLLDNAMTRLDQIEAEARASASPSGPGSDGIHLTTAPKLAYEKLSEVLSILNTDVAGSYVFGGSVTDRPPVASTAAIMEGEGTRDGFRKVVEERRQADYGADGLGRLTLSNAGPVVGIARDGVHDFGLQLGSTTSTNPAAMAVTGPAGAPPALDVAFDDANLPVPGDAVRITMTLPDGRSHVLEVRAMDPDVAAATLASGQPLPPGNFVVGPDADTTAANFRGALESGLEVVRETSLRTSSIYAAADNFFNDRGEPVVRVPPPPETATGTVAATDADTVLWYSGSDAPGNPRQSVTARTDDNTKIAYGVQANEYGIAQLVRTLASLAVETFPENDPHAAVRFDDSKLVQLERLSEKHNVHEGSIEVIVLELGVARNTAGKTEERHTMYKNQLQTMLAGVEEAPLEQVAMEMLALQVRLQASYQSIATVSQLSLVNYLR